MWFLERAELLNDYHSSWQHGPMGYGSHKITCGLAMATRSCEKPGNAILLVGFRAGLIVVLGRNTCARLSKPSLFFLFSSLTF